MNVSEIKSLLLKLKFIQKELDYTIFLQSQSLGKSTQLNPSSIRQQSEILDDVLELSSL